MHDKSRKQALGGAYRLKRKMRDVMAQARGEATHLRAEERAEIHILQNELHSFYRPVEALTLSGIHARPATRLVTREHKESGKERERDENEDEVSHGV